MSDPKRPSGADLLDRTLLAAYEVAVLTRAQLEAKIARIRLALKTDDASVLREGDVPNGR